MDRSIALDFCRIADLVEIYFEQANVFSALVGMFGTRALDSVSNYEKHRHTHTAQQRFPDQLALQVASTPGKVPSSPLLPRPWAFTLLNRHIPYNRQDFPELSSGGCR